MCENSYLREGIEGGVRSSCLIHLGGRAWTRIQYTDWTGPLAIGPSAESDWADSGLHRNYHKSELPRYATTVGRYTLGGEFDPEGEGAQPHLFLIGSMLASNMMNRWTTHWRTRSPIPPHKNSLSCGLTQQKSKQVHVSYSRK